MVMTLPYSMGGRPTLSKTEPGLRGGRDFKTFDGATATAERPPRRPSH